MQKYAIETINTNSLLLFFTKTLEIYNSRLSVEMEFIQAAASTNAA